MTKLIFVLFSLLISNTIYANAAVRRHARERRIEHILSYHHGELGYEANIFEKIEIKNNQFYIVKYETKKYYYLNDPNRCEIKVETNIKNYRKATKEEINQYQTFVINLIISFVILIAFTIVACCIVYIKTISAGKLILEETKNV